MREGGREGRAMWKVREEVSLTFPAVPTVLAKESGNERALSVEGQDAVWSAPGALIPHNSLSRGTV